MRSFRRGVGKARAASRSGLAGIEAPYEGEPGYEKAKAKLKSAVEGREVEIRNKKGVDFDCLVCDVYFNGKNLADYFPEYKE